jgi:NADPH-dependent ferric siderophore reductase
LGSYSEMPQTFILLFTAPYRAAKIPLRHYTVSAARLSETTITVTIVLRGHNVQELDIALKVSLHF